MAHDLDSRWLGHLVGWAGETSDRFFDEPCEVARTRQTGECEGRSNHQNLAEGRMHTLNRLQHRTLFNVHC